ncbi:MAG: hypothetical protein ABIN36_10855 [Ferruginibacter sp.]
MNTPQQVAAVKAIVKIKNKILQSSDWDDIALMIQNAIDICVTVSPNPALDPLDRTKSKEWNVISLKRLIRSVKDKEFVSLDTAYPEIATSLLRLAMVFVEHGLEDVNTILAASLLSNGIFSTSKKTSAAKRH